METMENVARNHAQVSATIYLPLKSFQLSFGGAWELYDFHFQFNLIDFCLVWALAHEIHTRELCMQSCSQKYYEIPVGNLFIYEYIAHKLAKNIEHNGG